MAEKPTSRNLPAVADHRAPVRGSIHLPAEPGGFFATQRLRKQAAFVREHAQWLDARTTQVRSAQAYVDACHELARSIARVDWLPEVLEADYLRGRLQRAHDIEMDRIAHATTEAHARASMLEAVHAAQRFNSASEHNAGHAHSVAKGLTTAEVEMVAQRLPDMKRETLETLLMLLSGVLAEKNK